MKRSELYIGQRVAVANGGADYSRENPTEYVVVGLYAEREVRHGFSRYNSTVDKKCFLAREIIEDRQGSPQVIQLRNALRSWAAQLELNEAVAKSRQATEDRRSAQIRDAIEIRDLLQERGVAVTIQEGYHSFNRWHAEISLKINPGPAMTAMLDFLRNDL